MIVEWTQNENNLLLQANVKMRERLLNFCILYESLLYMKCCNDKWQKYFKPPKWTITNSKELAFAIEWSNFQNLNFKKAFLVTFKLNKRETIVVSVRIHKRQI